MNNSDANGFEISPASAIPDDSPVQVSDLIDNIYGMEFQWGFSDGN